MVTRAAFIQAVRAFKREHGGKLKDLLNSATNPALVEAFLTNPVVHGYLSRSEVTFLDKHPELRDSQTKAEHDESDHYELKIYQYLPSVILYRNANITTSNFYSSCTSRMNGNFFNKVITSIGQDSNDIQVDKPSAIYSISAKVMTQKFLASDGTSPRFLIDPNWKDAHASSCITIVDPNSGRSLVTLFMNSFRGDYYEYTKTRFRMKHHSIIPDSELNSSQVCQLKAYVRREFSVDLDDEALLTSKKRRLIPDNLSGVAFALNNTELGVLEFYPCVEAVVHFRGASKKPWESRLSIEMQPKLPFIDVSHHLQVAGDDQNCVLYGMNFIEAMVEMLKQPDVADRVYALAEATHEGDSDAEATLVQIFKEELKAYLPCYYDSDTGVPKTREAIEAFHLRQRWTLGGQSLSMFYPLESEESKEPEQDDVEDYIGLAALKY